MSNQEDKILSFKEFCSTSEMLIHADNYELQKKEDRQKLIKAIEREENDQ